MTRPVIASFAAIGIAFTPFIAKAAITTATVDRVSPARIALVWAATAPVDVYATERPDATIKMATLISPADGDGRHEIDDAGDVRRYFLLRERGSGKLVRVAERLLPLATGSNFRDLGGYPAAGGKRVRWGLIYRSGATPKLDSADVARVKSLGLTSMIDLRSSEERLMAPTKLTGIRYSAIDYTMFAMMPKDVTAMRNGGPLYRNMVMFIAPQMRIVFDDLLGRRGPVMYHCTAGQDRTGVTSAMILHALGVPRATIMQDYHLTTKVRQGQNEMVPITPAMIESNPVAKLFVSYQKEGQAPKNEPLFDPDGRSFLESAFDEVEKRYGSVDAFLAKEVGVGPKEIAQLRAAYLE